MSFISCDEPQCDTGVGAVELVIKERARVLGGVHVGRVLPTAQRKTVGPVIFLDHMGPSDLERGQGIDVAPHPHIGLATVTYLFDGAITHRDSLGFDQPISPGSVNWMIAGRGIVHSERTPPELRESGSRLHGVQAWVALPLSHEDTDPGFEHYSAAALPELKKPGVALKLIAGNLLGEKSPVTTFSNMFYAAGKIDAGASFAIPDEHAERAVFLVSGDMSIGSEVYRSGELLVLKPGVDAIANASTASIFMVLGGDPIDGRRHIWWNFVASSRARIEQAKQRWKDDNFGRVPGDDERLSLPEI